MAPDSTNGASSDTSTDPPDSITTAPPEQSPAISTLSDPSTLVTSAASMPNASISTGIPKTPERRSVNTDNMNEGEDGYDSDGQQAPWVGIEGDVEGFEVEEEEVIPDGNDDIDHHGGVESNPNPTNPSPGNEVSMISIEELMQLKVLELRAELKKRGLGIHGRKEDLRNRLKDAIERGVPVATAEEMMVRTGDEEMVGGVFDGGSKWVLLKQDDEELNEDDLRDVDGVEYRAPTEPENEGRDGYQKKRNYSEKFDRGVFSGTATLPVLRGRWKQVSYDDDGSVEYESDKQPIEETTPNIEWCESRGLSLDSHPVEWFDAFFPVKSKRQGGMNAFNVECLLSWTNAKARVMNAGLGGKYGDFEDFTLIELMRHIGLYLFHGLSPSPQVEMKFKSQQEDPVNGNDFVHSAFGGKAGKSARRHKHFKCFFACVNPLYPTPPRETHPNWKVQPLLKHMLDVSKKAMVMGRNLSVDEQTIGFQGRHKDKQRITYKKEGDGFLADTICGDGYTFAFYFCHEPVKLEGGDANVLKQYNLSPLHMRVLSLISQLPHRYYTIGMDNLYMSAKFCRAAYHLKQKAMLHGVTRPSLRGVPNCVKQKEVTRKADLEKVRNTVKVARLKGDSVCKDLVCVSLYDSKPVYILTNACHEVKWIEKKKKVWDDEKQENVWITFWRMNIIDFYNYNMGNVDIADQLRNVYRYDTQWHRNRKWWWALWWWGYQLMLTNSYILYKKYHQMMRSRRVMSHYDYIRAVAMAWIAPEVHWPDWNRRKTKRTRKRAGAFGEPDVVVVPSPVAASSSKRARRATMQDHSSGSSSISEGSSSSSAIEAKVVPRIARRMTDNTLDPMLGSMRCRLNKTLQHYPITYAKGKRTKCQLHRWARGRNGKEVRGKHVMKCVACDVQLCSSCWVVFHETSNLICEKANIAKSK